MRILLKSLISLVWQDYKVLWTFKQRINLKRKKSKMLEIKVMNEQIIKENQRVWKFYDIVMRYRWFQVLQSCQSVIPQKKYRTPI